MSTPEPTARPITKSQFKLGLNCLLKLKHARPAPGRQAPYSQAASQNDMLRLLAEGGGTVEALWRQKEPGRVGSVGHDDAVRESIEAIESAVEHSRQCGERVPLYEVTIAHAGFLARIDLLRVSPGRVDIIEMKAKSVVSDDVADEANEILGTIGNGKTVEQRTILAPWVPYLQDLAFQTVLLEDWLAIHGPDIGLAPDVAVEPGLILVNRSGSGRAGDVLSNFETTYKPGRHGPSAHVSYRGAGCSDTDLLVEMKGVKALVSRLIKNSMARDERFSGLGMRACMEAMADVVRHNRWPSEASRLSSDCKKCEFRTQGADQSGFDECWGRPLTRYHILTLPRVSDKQVKDVLSQVPNSPSQDALAADVPETLVTDSQRAAWTCLQSVDAVPRVSQDFQKQAHRDSVLRRGSAGAPCYFLDFECSIFPIPSQIGGHPYDFVPFQFEAHSLPCFNASLSERVRLPGFLDLEGVDPRHGFLLALRKQLGATGVVYHWHHYEATVLKALRSWLQSGAASAPPDSKELVAFIDSLVDEEVGGLPGRLCDLKEVAQAAFYHPDMLGSYSIKKVMPMAWRVESIREHFGPKHHAAGDPEEYDHPEDPYLSLPQLPQSFLMAVGGPEKLRELEAVIEEDSKDLPRALKNGGLATLFYHYVRMFGGGDRPEIRAQFRKYCGLDSAAMLMVFRYLTDVVPSFRPCAEGFTSRRD